MAWHCCLCRKTSLCQTYAASRMKNIIIIVMVLIAPVNLHAETRTAIFAGGCFWCMEPPFDKLEGVISTISGYTGGHTENPTYEQTSSGMTGHHEAIAIEYDSDKVSYETLLNVLWKNIDPFDASGQFCDKGPQYLAAVFYQNEMEQLLAQESKTALQKQFGEQNKIVTELLPAKIFYAAEDYHQDYYLNNPIRYKYYRFSCGRDKRLKQVNELLTGKF